MGKLEFELTTGTEGFKRVVGFIFSCGTHLGAIICSQEL